MRGFSDIPPSVGSMIQAVIDRWGLRNRLNETRVMEAWATIAGTHVNAVTDRVWVKGRRLHVRLTSAAWRHELHHQRQEWCRELNRHLGETLVDDIIFC